MQGEYTKETLHIINCTGEIETKTERQYIQSTVSHVSWRSGLGTALRKYRVTRERSTLCRHKPDTDVQVVLTV